MATIENINTIEKTILYHIVYYFLLKNLKTKNEKT